MIIIISFLEMADLYREDQIDSASREVDLGLGETNCIVQTHKVISKISVSIYASMQVAALKIGELITRLSSSTSLIY